MWGHNPNPDPNGLHLLPSLRYTWTFPCAFPTRRASSSSRLGLGLRLGSGLGLGYALCDMALALRHGCAVQGKASNRHLMELPGKRRLRLIVD